ncbi:MAG: Fic family protein [Deltaproteobacteria bacterium]|nr:Fic family protein [Deltaproteobacteria bacterium]
MDTELPISNDHEWLAGPMPRVSTARREAFAALDTSLDAMTRAWGRGLGSALEHHLLRFEGGGPCLRDGRGVTRERIAGAAAGTAEHPFAVTIGERMLCMERAVALGTAAPQLDAFTLAAMHRTVMGTRAGAGVLRTGPVVVGRYRPPPPERLAPALARLMDWLSASPQPPLLAAALAHAQLLNLHPFADGNGRVARALMRVVVRRGNESGLAPIPVWSCLAFTPTPIRAIHAAYRRDEPGPWLDSIARAADNGLAIARRLQSITRRLRTKGRPSGRRGAVVLRELWRTPITTAASLATALGCDRSSAERTLAVLERSGDVRHGPDDRTWTYPAMLDLLGRWDQQLASLSRRPVRPSSPSIVRPRGTPRIAPTGQ